jgi:hypothetical protein
MTEREQVHLGLGA